MKVLKNRHFFSLILFGMLVAKPLKASQNNFVSDEWFTNQITLTQFLWFLDHFDGSLDSKQKIFVYQTSERYRLNPVLVSAVLQCESGLISSKISDYSKARCAGYGIMNPDNLGFEKQVDRGCWLLRKAFDGYYPGCCVRHQRAPWVKEDKFFFPVNAATYARIVYCPVASTYIEHDKNGKEYVCGGNELFESVNNWFQGLYLSGQSNAEKDRLRDHQ